MKTYAFVLTALLAGAAIAADAPMADSAKAAPMKKHHKMHKKMMADSTAMAAQADTAAPMKKHHKKHKKMMADSTAAK